MPACAYLTKCSFGDPPRPQRKDTTANWAFEVWEKYGTTWTLKPELHIYCWTYNIISNSLSEKKGVLNIAIEREKVRPLRATHFTLVK